MDDNIARLAETAPRIRRGVCRLLNSLGYAPIWEFPLNNGRRADVLGLDERGRIAIVEIKSGRVDYLADRKWREYLDYCDRFYFAVEVGFPMDILPADIGLIVADAHGGSILRPSPDAPLNPNRRRKIILDLALLAGRRLQRADDPSL